MSTSPLTMTLGQCAEHVYVTPYNKNNLLIIRREPPGMPLYLKGVLRE